MSYTKTVWRNDTQPPINASNLNKIEQGIYDAHETVDPIAQDFPLYKSNTNALIEDMDEAQSDITDIQSQMLTDEQSVELANSIAKEYDPTADYFVGEFCTNLNKVWKCNTDIVGGETWDATHWDEIMSVVDLYTMLKNIVANQGTATEFDPITDAEIDEMFGTAAGTGTNAQDYVVEHYQNGNTEGYTKWASGKCEVWKRIYKNLSATVAWSGGIYYGTYTDGSITYTMNGFTGFIEPPSVQITLRAQGGNLFSLIGYHYAGAADPTTDYGTYYVYGVGSQSNIPSTIQLYAVGKWK